MSREKAQGDIIFDAKHIHKSYGPTHANNNLSLALRKGEIHGLIGENGSGKSTFLSIATGIQRADSGEMTVHGTAYTPASPVDANDKRIGFVVQELGLIGALPVATNIFLGRLRQFTRAGFLNTRKLHAAAREMVAQWGFSGIDVSELAGNLSVEKRKVVEIVKALAIDPEVLILDETTQALSLDARRRLYEIIHEQADKGTAVLLVTHDLEEVVDLADRLTILRDGSVVGVLPREELELDKVKRMMVGREMSGNYYRTDHSASYSDKVVLKVEGLTHTTQFRDISFDLHAGEIFGVCGLADSGIHELGKVLYGILPAKSGSVQVMDTGEYIRTPARALGAGLAYVPKDRDTEALMMSASIEDNLYVPSIDLLKKPVGYVSPRACHALGEKARKDFNIRCLGIKQSVGALSGGNKQKVSLGRWLAKADIRILIMDCPTRGVDVSVKAYIYEVMKAMKAEGLAMIVISDELVEAIGMADRLLVLKAGEAVALMNRDDGFTEEKIIEVMI